MKTNYDISDIQSFLADTENAKQDTIEQFSRGHISQAYGFEDGNGNRFVFRVAPSDKDFKADKFAYERFGSKIMIPKVVDMGKFDDDSYYCVSERADGVISDELTDRQMNDSLASVHEVFSQIFKADISNTSGYGHPDSETGNAPYPTWQAVMVARLDDINNKDVVKSAINIGLEPDLVEKFRQQYIDNLKFASEVRRLTHGDLGFDNLLIDKGKISAVIDWAGIGYGDWMYDFAKLDYWRPKRFGDSREFATKYDLDSENLEQRTALYWARSALSTIQWADEVKNEHIANWLRTHVKNRILI